MLSVCNLSLIVKQPDTKIDFKNAVDQHLEEVRARPLLPRLDPSLIIFTLVLIQTLIVGRY